MLIKDIVVDNHFVKVISDNNIGQFENFDIPEDKLHSLTGIEINSKEDFVKMKELGKFKSYVELENALLSCSPLPYLLLNQTAHSIPRAMTLVAKKTSGIVGFYVLSLNVSDFKKGVDANVQILNLLNQKLKKFRGLFDTSLDIALPDEIVLSLLKECVDEVNVHLDFKAQIGIDCDSSFNDVNELVSLVEKFDICYVEDPFFDLLDCKEFTAKARYKCLVCSELNRENYDNFLDKRVYSSVKITSESVLDLVSRMDFFIKNKIAVACSSVDLAVAFNFPILIIAPNEREKISKVLEIQEQIKKIVSVK